MADLNLTPPPLKALTPSVDDHDLVLTWNGAEAARLELSQAEWDALVAAAPRASTPPPPPPPPPPPAATLPAIGLVGSGAWAERLRQAVGATGVKLVRLDMAGSARWKATWAQEAFPVVRAAGGRVILLIPGTATWASVAAFVRSWLRPGDMLEYGNEDGYTTTVQSTLTSNAKAYAQRLQQFVKDMRAAGVDYPVLAQADPAMRGTAWIDGLYAGAANLHTLVGGFTVHPYGPGETTFKADRSVSRDGYRLRLKTMLDQLTAKGAPADVPILLTEYGISTDNGRTLDSNYDYPTNLTYAQAGDLLVAAIRDIATLPANVVAIVVYQDVDQANPGASTGRESYFGVIRRTDGSIKAGLTDKLAALVKEAS